MSTAMMSAPSRASVMAWLRPWPRAAPVIKATLPSTRPVIVLSSLSLYVCCVQYVVLVLFLHASFATDRLIRRRSIRMIYAGPPVFRRVPHNRGLTVVAGCPRDNGMPDPEQVGPGPAASAMPTRATAKPSHHHSGPQPPRARARAHAHRVMTAHAVEVAARARRALSGGKRAAAVHVLALIGQPEAAVLEELTTGLDPEPRQNTGCFSAEADGALRGVLARAPRSRPARRRERPGRPAYQSARSGRRPCGPGGPGTRRTSSGPGGRGH